MTSTENRNVISRLRASMRKRKIGREKKSNLQHYGFDQPDGHFEKEELDKFEKKYTEVIARRERRWQTVNYASSPRNNKMKRFVRKGIPPGLRAQFWLKVTGVDEKITSQPQRFQELLNSQLSADLKNVITTDVPRTFPENSYFGPSGQESLAQKLTQVLRAFAVATPEIGYCQGLNFLAAELLLVVRDEEKAFWLLEHLIKEVVPRGYYMPSMSDLKRDCEVLGVLVKEKMPELSKRLASEGLSFVVICTKWFICLYCDTLPFETSLRILDCLFYEGDKILFRVGLTLLKMNEKELEKNCKTFPQLLTTIQTMMNTESTLFCHEFMESDGINHRDVTGVLWEHLQMSNSVRCCPTNRFSSESDLLI